ncbi:hypothetical protein EVAR_21368_1 [Eumeta japonica]|uniref:Uncharacterized protein n=1 Tax=Eumeta variegata TaxID=151549 RepID=A0A4C1YF33_EUMVA|nr:hypothetical protein EVAR_21368_1 [Eumeta japonica]
MDSCTNLYLRGTLSYDSTHIWEEELARMCRHKKLRFLITEHARRLSADITQGARYGPEKPSRGSRPRRTRRAVSARRPRNRRPSP